MAADILDVNVGEYNFEKICRLCLSEDGPMLSLPQLVQSSSYSPQCEEVRRVDKIYYSVCITIAQQDDLPCQICQKCDRLVNNYYNFKETCSLVDRKLHGLAKRRRERVSQSYAEHSEVRKPGESILKNNTDNSKVQIPSSKMRHVSCDKSQSTMNKLPKTADYEFISTPPLNLCIDKNNTGRESVIISTAGGEDEGDENAEDPLEIKIEDLKNMNNNNMQYNKKSKYYRKAASQESLLMKEKEAVVRLLMQGSANPLGVVGGVSKDPNCLPSSGDLELVGREINLDCKMRREDVTLSLDQFFPHKDVSRNTTSKLLDLDNSSTTRLPLPKDQMPSKQKLEIHKYWNSPRRYKNITPIEHDTSILGRRRSPQKVEPKLKILKVECVTIGPKKSQRVAPYTYSKRSPKLETEFLCKSDEPTESKPSNEDQGSSVLDPPEDDKDELWYPITMKPVIRDCIECGVTFPTYLSLVEHIKTHNAVIKTVNCDQCEKTFKSEVLLASHVFMRHKNKSDRYSLCHICGLVLDDKKNLTHHMNKHFGKKDYLCDTCGAGYYNRFDLVHHIKRKHLEADLPKPKCTECGAEVSTPESLRRHMLLHTRGPTEKCPLCPKLFARKAQVDRHMRSHTGETPYVCEVCNRGFTIKWNHTQHMRLHTKAKPYVCDVCGKAFTHNVSRRSHMKRHKEGESVVETSRLFQRIDTLGKKQTPESDVPSSQADSAG